MSGAWWTAAVMTGALATVAGQVPEAVVLRVGESARFEALEVAVSFRGVSGDSRCPKDARCIRAGEAVVELMLQRLGEDPRPITVEVPPGGGATAAVPGLTIQIVSLDPQAEEGIEIPAADYRLTVRVQAGPAEESGDAEETPQVAGFSRPRPDPQFW